MMIKTIRITKSMKNILLSVILMLSLAHEIKSQADTVTPAPRCDTSYTECNRVYMLFIANRNREVKHLWKLNMVGGYNMENLCFGYEQRISKSITTESCLIGDLLGLYGWRHLYFGVSQSVRYYYNLGRRERLGKRINGFCGNYFSIGGFLYNSSPYNKYDGVAYIPPFNYPPRRFGVDVLYGLQRRLGNIGYVELFLGVEAYKPLHQKYYHNSEIGFKPEIGIRAGFAIDSFKEIKRAFKPL
jgi:hypothetical protein